MSITEEKEEEVTFLVPVLDRTITKPKYDLSVCLAPMYGNESKWLMLTEVIEHYKLQGVQHLYVYVKDIDDYSHLVLDDYEKSGEIEVVYLEENKTDLIRNGMLLGCRRRLCSMKQDEHAKRTQVNPHQLGPPDKKCRHIMMTFIGELTLKQHLPTLVFHNTSAIAPANHIAKCVIDPARGAYVDSLRKGLLSWVQRCSRTTRKSPYTALSCSQRQFWKTMDTEYFEEIEDSRKVWQLYNDQLS
ncbi:unnamed protein product [Cylicocyclus nassatus]|uniref:Glycosyltransferase family 92 protein n=1 Tax=Cylicocyclus nassatus TaxID=53992 RepID=A0AA36H981_CYLNA|nr:unnamed protein product [Cylicocyclus nassatus]